MSWDSPLLHRPLAFVSTQAYDELRQVTHQIASRPSLSRLFDRKLARWALYGELATMPKATPLKVLKRLTEIEDTPTRRTPKDPEYYGLCWKDEVQKLRQEIRASIGQLADKA